MIKLLAIIVTTIYVIEYCHADLLLKTDFHELNLNFNQIKQLIESFDNETLVQAAKFASDTMERMKTMERNIAAQVKIEKGSISFAQLLESLPGKDVKDANHVAEIILKATTFLQHTKCFQLGISHKDCVKFLSKYQLPESSLKNRCHDHLNKTDYKPYRRLLPADYKDGLRKFRHSVVGHELPSAREVARTLFLAGQESFKTSKNDKTNENSVNNDGFVDGKRSLSVAQWAQFLEQDVAKTVFSPMENGSPIECCDTDSTKAAPRYTHPNCAPITISGHDYFYKPLRVTCLNYVRSALAIDPQCKFGDAQQINQATNKFDLSQLYGTTKEETKKLRSYHNGQLKISNNYDNPFLPVDSDNCLNNSPDTPCYHSGDSRVNSNPYVTTLYTIFLRSHNQIAQKLKYLNPQWHDGKIFDISRKINTAIYQKIVYLDWSSVVLGNRIAEEVINKKHDDNEFSKEYKSDKVSNEFATAGIKIYNTMLPGDLSSVVSEDDLYLTDKYTNIIDASDVVKPTKNELFKLEDVFYKPKDLSKNRYLEQIENAILQQPAMALDSSYVDDLAVQFYRSKMHGNLVFGTDSLAFDIQRGRDHGLPSYVDYIKKCMNIKITKWEDLNSIVKEDDLQRLQSIYSSYQDIDVIVGGLCEIPQENATIGPTFACFIGEQLISSKLSDDDFYDRYSEEFDDKLLKTVENYTATRLICDSTKLNKVQRNIFLLPSIENPMINCSNYEEIPKLDLSYWLDH